MVFCKMSSWSGDKGAETAEKIQRTEDNVSGSICVR